MSGPAHQSLFGGGLRTINLTISANTTHYNVFTSAGSPTDAVQVNVTVNAGIYVYSTALGTPGMDLGAGWATGSRCKIINNGFILGKGGNASTSPTNSTLTPAQAGTEALKLQAAVSVSIENNSYIAGGGGGGGGFIGTSGIVSVAVNGGGGAGAGDGGSTWLEAGSAAGGTGGAPGSVGGNGTSVGGFPTYHSGAGGGRQLPGSSGAGATSGADAIGGGAGSGAGMGNASHTGGAGGSSNNVGGNGVDDGSGTGAGAGGGGGGWGAAGGDPDPSSAITGITSSNGGAAGKAINYNGNPAPTILVTGNIFGATS